MRKRKGCDAKNIPEAFKPIELPEMRYKKSKELGLCSETIKQDEMVGNTDCDGNN
jgi:hypothetical protein